MKTYSEKIKEIKRLIDGADAVFAGAGDALNKKALHLYRYGYK